MIVRKILGKFNFVCVGVVNSPDMLWPLFWVGASYCYVCPAGYQCIKAVLPDPCPAGFYCTEGTGYDTQPCPVGTIGSRTGLATESECTQCPGGFYCETAGRATTTGKCREGRYQKSKLL